MRRSISRRKRARDKMNRRRELEIDQEKRPDERMGELQLRQYGLRGRASQRLRRKLKQTTSRARRRHDRQLSRRYMPQ